MLNAARTGKPEIVLSFISREPTHRWSFAKKYFSALGRADPRLGPDLAGYTETTLDPVRQVDELERWWVPDGLGSEFDGPPPVAHSLEWKRRSQPRQAAFIEHGLRNRRGEIVPAYLSYECTWLPEVPWKELFFDLCLLAKPELAMLHAFAGPELLFDPESIVGEFDDFRRNWVKFQLGSFGYALDPKPANIAWGMAFGGRFAAEVEPRRIRDAGFSVCEIPGGWVITASDSLTDVVDRFENFAARRGVLRSLFRKDLFAIQSDHDFVARASPSTI